MEETWQTHISGRYFRRKEGHKAAPGAWVMVGKGLFGWITGHMSKGQARERLCESLKCQAKQFPALFHKQSRDAEGCLFESIKMMLTELSIWERTLYGIKEIKAPRLRLITAEHSDNLDVILSKLVEWKL